MKFLKGLLEPLLKLDLTGVLVFYRLNDIESLSRDLNYQYSKLLYFDSYGSNANPISNLPFECLDLESGQIVHINNFFLTNVKTFNSFFISNPLEVHNAKTSFSSAKYLSQGDNVMYGEYTVYKL